jgi:predicted nucleic acid-binding protein
MACVSYGDEKADLFAPYFESALRILVPVIVLYEVRRILLLRPSRTLAEVFVSEALRREIIAIDQTIALAATAMSVDHQLVMADALPIRCGSIAGARSLLRQTHILKTCQG